jgi:hypothetical protein
MSAERLFAGDKSYNALVAKGPVVGLEFAGTNSVEQCQKCLQNLIESKYPKLPRKSRREEAFSRSARTPFFRSDFISQSVSQAREQLDKFYNFASMQMFA